MHTGTVCICPRVHMQRRDDMNIYMKIRIYTNRPILYLWVGLPARGDGWVLLSSFRTESGSLSKRESAWTPRVLVFAHVSSLWRVPSAPVAPLPRSPLMGRGRDERRHQQIYPTAPLSVMIDGQSMV